MMFRIAAVAATLLLAATALAQESEPTPVPAAPAAPAEPAAPKASPEHVQAALAFIAASGATRGFEEMIPQFLDQVRLRFVGQRPEIADMINEATFALVPEFVKRRDDLNNALAELYATRFTEAELTEMTAFYASPVGQKLAKEQVDVLQKSVPIVQAWSRKLTEDMTVRIRDEVKKKGQQL